MRLISSFLIILLFPGIWPAPSSNSSPHLTYLSQEEGALVKTAAYIPGDRGGIFKSDHLHSSSTRYLPGIFFPKGGGVPFDFPFQVEHTKLLDFSARDILGSMESTKKEGSGGKLLEWFSIGGKDYLRITFALLTILIVIFFIFLVQRERTSRASLFKVSEGAARALVRVLELKDTRSRGHSERVSQYARMMAKALRISEMEISLGGLLHDVGKIALPDTILEKPTFLSPEEWEIMKKHPELGYLIVTTIEPLKDVAPWIRWHHERWDGSGYPDGLKGDEIPVEAQIISLADAFDSMTKRPYLGKIFKEDEALSEIEKRRGSYWNPKVVDVALRSLHVVEEEKVRQPLFQIIDRVRRSPYSAERLFVLYQIAEEIRLLGNLETFLHRILEILRGVVGYEYRYSLYLLEETDSLSIAASLGYEENLLGKSLPPEKGLPGWAMRFKESIVSIDTEDDPRYFAVSKEISRSEISVPLVVGERAIGVLDVTSPEKDAFRKTDLEFLEMVSSAVSGAIEAARLYRKLQQLAFYDPLTGVHTFHHLADTFNSEKEKWLEQGKIVSIAFIDTDGLKVINDLYGHLVGDDVLRTFARTLKDGIGDTALIGRYGGDEFVVLLPGSNIEEARNVIKRLMRQIDKRKIKVGEKEIPLIRFSFGISEFPKDGLDLEALIRKADERMYTDKRKKK